MINKFALIFLPILFIGFFSCHDTGPEIENTVKAFRGTLPWSGTAQVIFHPGAADSVVSIKATVRNSITHRDDILSFIHVPLTVGSYQVFPHMHTTDPTQISSTFGEIQGGDVIYQFFEVDTNYPNSLTVESYDPFLKKIIISFQVSFISLPGNQLPEEKFTLFDGKIVAIVEE